jgi:hypothetical protein
MKAKEKQGLAHNVSQSTRNTRRVRLIKLASYNYNFIISIPEGAIAERKKTVR